MQSLWYLTKPIRFILHFAPKHQKQTGNFIATEAGDAVTNVVGALAANERWQQQQQLPLWSIHVTSR
jgi:hypothetical protein